MAQAKTQKVVNYKEAEIEALLSECSIVAAEFTVQLPDGTQKAIKMTPNSTGFRKGSKESGKGDNLRVSGPAILPDGLGKAQVSANITPWHSKKHYGID